MISGNNFPEPTLVNFRTPRAAFVPIQVTSVSNTSIIVTMPKLTDIVPGGLSCGNVDGNIELSFPGLTCTRRSSVPFSYHTDPPSVTSASPTNLSQDGSPLPGPGAPATITVLGSNFQAPMTVTLLKDGIPVPGTPINNANVSNPTVLSFAAPAVPNSSLNQQNCSSGGTITGVKYVPTSFGIRVTNTLTGCSADLPNVLVYNPIDTTCRAALSISPLSLPNGKVGMAYVQIFTAAGGAGAAVHVRQAGGALPAGAPAFALTAGGALTGTPTVAGTSNVQDPGHRRRGGLDDPRLHAPDRSLILH